MSKNIKLLTKGAPVRDIYWALQQHPDLWNQHTGRTKSPDSPHYGLDDIWARFGDSRCAETGEAHEAHWYEAADVIPGLRELVMRVCQNVGATKLGGVLITRIPAGKICLPHTDLGWHALEYEKIGVQITSAPGQKFCFEDGTLETQPGDVFWFCNQPLHWVINPTPYERISMVICVKTDMFQGER